MSIGDERIKEPWYIYTMQYYSAMKRNMFESVLRRWTNLEPIIQSEVSQKERYKYCMKVKSESEVAQSCPTLFDPMDCSLPGSSIHGIFQARVLEWAAISFSRRSSQPRDWTQVSHIVGRRFTVWATREVIWNLKRWHWWIYFQGSNGDTDIENRPMDMGGEGAMHGDSNIEIYNTLCKIDTNGNLLCASGTQTGSLWQAEGCGREGDKREVQEGGDKKQKQRKKKRKLSLSSKCLDCNREPGMPSHSYCKSLSCTCRTRVSNFFIYSMKYTGKWK